MNAPSTDALEAARLVDRLERLARLDATPDPLNAAQWEALRYLARANRYSRTPAAVVARLNAAAHEAMRAPSFAAAMRTQAAKPEPSTPEELAALQRSEREAYGAAVRALGISVEG